MVFSFAGVIGRHPKRLRDIIGAMRKALLVLWLAACGGHRAAPAEPGAPMVAEAFVPIAATGRFGPIPGGAFLRMVERKVEWLIRNHERLSRAAG